MSERVKKVPLWVFGLLVAGALAFGAKRAVAEPVFLTCSPLVYNGGTCSSQAECVLNCNALYPNGYDHAYCNLSVGCCRCFL
jgi:hypothetical protein